MKGLMLYGIFVFYLISFSRATDNFASKCCRRVPNMITVGQGISGKFIQLDEGRCSTSCEKSTQQSSHYLSKLQRKQNQQNQPEIATCDLGKSRRPAICEPSLVHAETLAFNQGPKFYEIVDQCVCRKVPRRCERVSKMKRFFVGTEFEAAVDIGECRGRCKKDGKVCKPTRTTSHPIMGPNGLLSVKTIRECRCEPTCYRQHFNLAVMEKTENADGNTIFKTKVIDVGRCAGTCGPIEQCVVKENRKGRSKCLMSLQSHDVTCTPIRIHHITYTNSDGNEKRVVQIRRCGCK